LAAFAANAAVVYKWIDGDGVVHYSDQPVPGAEKIYTSSSGKIGTVAGPAAGTPAAKKPGNTLIFEQFAITSPSAEQSFFGDEIISVSLALEPSLGPNQIITWRLNGKPLTDQPQDAAAFALHQLERGSYAIAATITDQTTGESLSTQSVTFYVRQPSALSPQSPLKK